MNTLITRQSFWLLLFLIIPLLGQSQTYTVSTFAGSGSQGATNGTGTAASFKRPSGVATDASGNVYVADYHNHRVRKITPAGVVSTLAGSGSQSFADGTGTGASFAYPAGVAVDASGNVYVADQFNHRIRKITPAGVVTTLAGGSAGYADGTGAAAAFTYPYALILDASGNVYVSDQYNHRIRKITPSGVVTTFAGSGSSAFADGTGTAASFSYPNSLVFDAAGNLFVADYGNHRIRKITPSGVVTTFAGSGNATFADGNGTSASFSNPAGITMDAAGNLFVSEYQNVRVRKITTSADVTTIAGTGSNGNTNGTGLSATFDNPASITIDPSGNLFVSDLGNNLIRKITLDCITPSTPTISGNLTFLTGGSTTLTSSLASAYIWSNGATTQSITVNTAGSYTVRVISGTCTSATSATSTVQLQQYNVTTFAGSITDGNVNGTGPFALLSNPSGIVVDGNGNFYVTDYNTNRIRKITSGGAVTNFAGSGENSFADGSSTSAAFSGPYGIAIDGSGNLYIADQSNNRIRKITPAGVVSTFAGSGNFGYADGNGNTASFRSPSGVAVDAQDNVYVADLGNNRIRKITPAGVVSTLAGSGSYSHADGNGTSASIKEPSGIAVDASGNVYVAETGGNYIRKITSSGQVTTIAGTGAFNSTDGIGTAAAINHPRGVTVGADGTIYVAEEGSHNIRKITTDLKVTTIAGSGNGTFADGLGTAASFQNPVGMVVDANNNLFVADYFNNRIRKVSPYVPCSTPSTPTISAGGSTTLCTGGSVTLTSSASSGNLWSTGETTQSIAVTSAGSYSLLAIIGDCSSSISAATTVSVTTSPSAPTISAGSSTTFCTGGSVVLTSSSPIGNVWSTGATTPSITVTSTGSYTVSNIVGLCTSPSSTATNITVNSIPTTPEINPSGTVNVIQGNSQVLSAPSGYAAYIWSTGANTQTITASTAGSYTVRVVSSAGCTSSLSDAAVITVSASSTTWNGTTWNNGIPNATLDAFVNGNLTVSTPFTAKSLTVNSGTIALSADVTVNGNVNTLANSVTGSGNIILGGSSSQSIAGNFKNLKLANAAGATLSSDLNIRGILSLASGTLNVNSQGLAFIATSFTNGTIDDFSAGYTGTIAGNYNFQIFIAGTGVVQKHIAAPVTGLTLNSISVPCSSVQVYDETANNFGNSSTNCLSQSLTAGNSILRVANAGVVTLRGGNSTGTVSFPLARTNAVSTATLQYGFNALGNPYPSAIDWTKVSAIAGNTAVSNLTAWVLRGGQWATITSAGVATNGLSKNIGPGIGFLVRRSTVTGTANLVFNNSIRTNASPVFYRSATAPEQVKLTLSSTATDINDEAVIYSDESASVSNDDLDAPKLFSPEPTAPSLYVLGEESQSIAALPMLTEAGRIVKVAVNAAVSGTYTLDAEIASMPFGLNVMIEDATTHKFLPTNAVFNMTAGETKQFNLHFTKAGMSTTSLNVYPNPAKDQFFVNVASPIVLQVLNTLGQVVITQTIDANTAINTASLPASVYTLKAEGFKATSLVVSK